MSEFCGCDHDGSVPVVVGVERCQREGESLAEFVGRVKGLLAPGELEKISVSE